MKGFLISALALTFMEALLWGQDHGSGPNITGLLGVPEAVARRFLDPKVPFFSKAAPVKPSSATTTPSAGPGRTVLT